jgi:ribosomal protein L18
MRGVKAAKAFALHFFFSNHYLYAHIQRRADGVIVASASTIERTLRESLPNRTDVAAATRIGALRSARLLSLSLSALSQASC